MKRTKGNRGSKIFATLIAFVMAFCSLLGSASDAWAEVATSLTTVSSDEFSTVVALDSANEIEVFFLTDDFQLSAAEMTASGSNWTKSTEAKYTYGASVPDQTGIVYWDGFTKKNTETDTVSCEYAYYDSEGNLLNNDGVTGTVKLEDEQFSLKWSDMAITATGEKLDVEIVVSDVTITYVAWGDDSVDENGLPITGCATMFSDDNGLWFSAFPVCDDLETKDQTDANGNTYADGLSYTYSAYAPSGQANEGNGICYGVTCDYTINFYDSSDAKYTEGNFDFFMTDIDVSDQIAINTEWIKDGYQEHYTSSITGNTQGEGSRAYYYRGGTYAESTTISEGGSTIYAIDDTELAIKNGRVYCEGELFNHSDRDDKTAIHAAVSTGTNSFSWSGSGCGSKLFDVDDLPSTLVITKDFESKGEGCEDLEFTAEVSFSDGTSKTVKLTYDNDWTATITGITASGYTVTETNIPDGYDYVEGSSDTEVKTVNGIETAYLTFKNSYSASGEFTAEATKVLSGRDLEKGEFTFQLTDANGNVVGEATNAADGSVTFDKVEVDAAGTYTYYISEVEGTDSDITYDTHKATVTVLATDNGNGKLSCTVGYGTTDSTSNTFTNSVKTGNLTITKAFESTGEGYEDLEFTATVSFSDGTSRTVTLSSSNDWTATISDITAGTTYTVTETDIPDGYTLVTSSDDLEGTIVADETSKVTITNSYSASGQFTAEATKVLSGRDLEKGEFTFQLTDANGNVVGEATNAADGSVTFDKVEVDAAGTYTYYISEVVPGTDDDAYDAVITYDTHKATVTVKATDDGKGNLTCTVSYGSTDGTSNTFTNSVKTGSLTITKAFESTGEGYEDLEFTATVSFSDGTSRTVTLSSSNDWTATISDITAGTTYTVTETDIPDGYTLVTSSDDLVGTIVADETSKVTITNSYSAKGTWTPTASKTLTGGLDLDEGDYSFVVTDKSGNTVLTGTNASATSEGLISSKAEASISFGSITYTLSDVGTYTYYISEVVPSEDDEAYDEDITYDTTKHTVVVTVADNGDGTLGITAVYDDDSDATGVTFTNKYNHTSVLPETGSNGIFLGLAAAVVVLAVSCVAIKRRSGRAGSGSHFK